MYYMIVLLKVKLKKRYNMKENTKLTLAIIIAEIMLIISIIVSYTKHAYSLFGYLLVVGVFINIIGVISFYFYRKEKAIKDG